MTDGKAHPNIAIDAMVASEIMEWPIVEAGGEEWFEKAIERGVRPPFFAVWPEGGTTLFEDDIGTKTRDFRPSTNVRDAIEALSARFKDRQYKVVITGEEWYDGGEWQVEIYHPIHVVEKAPLAVEKDPDNLALAISKAMVAAVRKETNQSGA